MRPIQAPQSRKLVALTLALLAVPFLILIDLFNTNWHGRELGLVLVTILFALWVFAIFVFGRRRSSPRSTLIAAALATFLSSGLTLSSLAYQQGLGKSRYSRALFKASSASALVTLPVSAQALWDGALRELPLKLRYLAHLTEDGLFVRRLKREFRSNVARNQLCGQQEALACFDEILSTASEQFLITQTGVTALMALRAQLIHEKKSKGLLESFKTGLKHFESWSIYRQVRQQQDEHWRREFPAGFLER